METPINSHPWIDVNDQMPPPPFQWMSASIMVEVKDSTGKTYTPAYYSSRDNRWNAVGKKETGAHITHWRTIKREG